MSKPNRKSDHPEHPVRNFFMMLLCLLFLVGFCAFWYALAKTDLANRNLLLYGGAGLTAIGVLTGILTPAVKAIKYASRRK